jgi:autotransporter-associated beta strand protein
MNRPARLALLLLLLLATPGARAAQSSWVYYNTAHALVYSNDNLGNRLPDFSFAGYQGGGVAIPSNQAIATNLSAIAGDNTASIQNAINYVSGLTPDTNGFRGVVLLNAGTYQIAGTLTMASSGVILRGSGNNTNTGTVLLVTGLSRNVITVGGSGSWSQTGGTYTITNNYVPLGATQFNVSSASSFAAGDFIVVQRPQTQPWIDAIGMNLLTNPWTPGGGLYFERQITAINGNQITIDDPLCNPIESVWTTGQVFQVTDASRIQQVGIENLCGVGRIADYPSNALNGVFIIYQNLKNGWARNILMSGWGNGLSLNAGLKWCTVQDCQYVNPATGTNDDAPAAYTVGDSGALCLFQRCTSSGGYYHIMVTQAGTPGPNVFLYFTCVGTHYNGGPHQRWAVGALHDNINMGADTQGGYTPYLAINNRGNDGSGQGWGAGFSVMYNCQVPQFQLEQPATTTNQYNWVIGGLGAEDAYSDNGIYDAPGNIVNPNSLYLEQLRERLGGAAIENIGYQLFTIAATPSAQEVIPGGNAAFTVNVGDPALMGNVVALSVSGLPPGVGASFSTNAVIGASSATLTITASNSATPGVCMLNVIGANGGLAHTNTVNLTIGGFGLSVSPAAQTVNLGAKNTSFTLTVTTNSGFSGTVTFGVSGLPANASAAFNPASLNAAGSSTLTVTVSSNTPGGNYTLIISATNGNAVAGVMASLTIAGAPGAVLTWNGGSAADNDWSDAANWGGDSIASNDFLIFAGAVRLNNTNDTTAATTYSNLVFNAGAGAFVLNGNPIICAGSITNNSTNSQTVNLGLNFSNSITFDGAGGLLIIGGGLTNTLGTSGSSTLTLEGSGILTNRLSSALSPGGTNVILLNDSAANWTLMDNASSTAMTAPWVFEVNNGTFNFGAAASAPTLTATTVNGEPGDNQVGTVADATGTFNMVNGTLTTGARLNTATAVNATGVINLIGGTMNIGSQFQGANGSNPGEISIVNISGGTMNIGSAASPTDPFYVASRGTGALNVNSGALNCGKLDLSRNADGNSVSSVGTVNLNGGTLTVTSVTNISANQETNGSPRAAFNFNGGTLKAGAGASAGFFQGSTVTPVTPITTVVQSGGAFINDGGNSITILEPLQHDAALGGGPDGGLTKLGSGTITLTAVATYNGNTVVNAGTLALSGAGSISNSAVISLGAGTTLSASGRSDGTLTLAAGQTLSGFGTINGLLLVGSNATVSPGGGGLTGLLKITGAVTLQGVTLMKLNPSAATNDVLSAAGIAYGGTLCLTNIARALTSGDSFKLFSAAVFSGAFTNLVPAIPGAGLGWNTNALSFGVLSVVSVPVLPPLFSGATWRGTNLVFSGTNGVTNGIYYVLASTNLSLPTTNWPVLATNTFDGNGNFSFTNAPGSTAPQTFYLLKVP